VCQMAFHPCEETFACVLIHDIQDVKSVPIVCPVLHEVITPDMVAIRRSQPDAGSIIEPKTTPFRLPDGHFQAFWLPDTLDTLVVHDPSLYEYETRVGTLRMADAGWERSFPVTDGRAPKINLGEAEALWLNACWQPRHWPRAPGFEPTNWIRYYYRV
jgi:hypothetical protein